MKLMNYVTAIAITHSDIDAITLHPQTCDELLKFAEPKQTDTNLGPVTLTHLGGIKVLTNQFLSLNRMLCTDKDGHILAVLEFDGIV